jgi:DNA-directed RNA polymerase specialized sigma24 family protein
MASRSTGASSLRELNALTQSGVVGNLPDSELLDRFLARSGDSSDSAFEVLVGRHGPMVLDLCHNVLRDYHDAQDALQATFMVLASQAKSIRRRDALASWLLGVAHRVAVRARAKAVRQRMYEMGAAEMGTHHEGDRPESWPELHEEIGRPPARYRGPVVRCYH